MKSRRVFLKKIALTGFAAGLVPVMGKKSRAAIKNNSSGDFPLVLATWSHGFPANEEAWKILSSGGRALDAVEQGVRIIESDPKYQSVGKGGRPDRDGHVTLDACIMNESGDCGAVAFLENIANPVSVARLVMEKTPHVMLVGEGAYAFAIANGFKKEKLLTEESEKEWKEWLKESSYKPVISVDNHDTIAMIAIDKNGNLSGTCTTSGLAWKMHGRVGDSPIIGAGLYVDNEVGAACATGVGEAVIRQCGSFLIVELMRQGISPTEACKTAIERIMKHEKKNADIQVGFLAINKKGETGAYAIQKGFSYAMHTNAGNRMVDSDFGMR